MQISSMLKRLIEMAEITRPYEMMKAKKPDGFEQIHRDKIETMSFEGFRIHFFTSLTNYTFIIVGQKDSVVPSTVFNQIYQAFCDHCLKDPSYTVNQPVTSPVFKTAIERMFNTA